MEMTVENQKKVFVCYSRKDEAFARLLAEDLKKAGIYIWMDQFDIPAGAPWDREVESALSVTKTTLVILSPNAVESNNVRDEIGAAVDAGDYIVPVLLAPCEIPLRIRRHQFVDFTKGYEAALKQLVASLSNVGEAVPEPKMEVFYSIAASRTTTGKKSTFKRVALFVVVAAVSIIAYESVLRMLAPTPPETEMTAKDTPPPSPSVPSRLPPCNDSDTLPCSYRARLSEADHSNSSDRGIEEKKLRSALAVIQQDRANYYSPNTENLHRDEDDEPSNAFNTKSARIELIGKFGNLEPAVANKIINGKPFVEVTVSSDRAEVKIIEE